MYNNDSKTFWSSQKVYLFKDPSTGATLNIDFNMSLTVDKSWGSNFSSLKTTFTIRDKKTAITDRAKIDLDYADLKVLIAKMKTSFMNGPQAAFKNATQIFITKIYHNCKKDLIIKVISISDTFKIYIEIVDKVNTTSKAAIVLSWGDFCNIINCLNNIDPSYFVVSSNMMNNLSLERLVDSMSDVKNSFDVNFSKLSNLSVVSGASAELTPPIEQDENNTISEDNPFELEDGDIKIPDHEDDYSEQESFMEKLESIDLDKIEIDGNFNKPSDSKSSDQTATSAKTEKQLLNSSPLFNNFLSNNAKNIIAWIHGYIHGDFNPFEEIMKLAFIPKTEIDHILSYEKMNMINEILKKQFVDHTNKYLKKEVTSFDVNCSIFDFGDKFISKDTPKLFELCEEMIVLVTIMQGIRNNYINKFNVTDNVRKEESMSFNMATAFFTRLVIVFTNSMRFSNVDVVKSEILNKFVHAKNNNVFKSLDELCSNYSIGGSFEITLNMFESWVADVFKIFGSFKSRINKDVDLLYCEMFPTNHIHVDEDISSEDVDVERLRLMKDLTDQLNVDDVYKNMINQCDSYTDVLSKIKEHNLPFEIIKLKRVLDASPHLINDKKAIIESYRNLNESEQDVYRYVISDIKTDLVGKEKLPIDFLDILNED